MALINRRTGYYGFTLDGLNGINSDKNGSVKKCIITITYQLQPTDVDFIISNGTEDWGAQMGDGSIIPLSNPKVLYQNRDNAIVEFDMAVEYPANSPCILVYTSDTANFIIKAHEGEARPFTENSLSGHFAFTTEGYGGTVFENGDVNRLIATVPFPVQVADIEFSISAGDDHWGARMGDGSIINLRNPEVVCTNSDNAIVKFDMETQYPSNSPCIIVYRSEHASFNIKIITTPVEFVPVTDITGVPETLTAGVTADLSSCNIIPSNSTIKGIEWNVIEGNATVTGDTLTILGMGNIVLESVVPNGIDKNNDFTKRFNINVIENKITILAQPSESVKLVHGSIDGSISVNATSDTGVISYKWYHNTIASYSGATVVNNGNKETYRFPVSEEPGVHYYFCEISSPGATTVKTNLSKVEVAVSVQSIVITPRPSSIIVSEEVKFDVNYKPNNALKPDIIWKSSDPDILQIDSNGIATAMKEGNAVITAITMDGLHKDTININVPEYISVTNITGVTTNMSAGSTITLSGTVIPSDANSKTIKWSIIDVGTTGAVISSENKLFAESAGVVRIKATIPKGISVNHDFAREFDITVAKAFIPVKDIIVDIPTIRVGDHIVLTPVISPSNATNTHIEIIVSNPGTTGAVINDGVLTFTDKGTCTISMVVINGTSSTENFTKNITLNILDEWIPVSRITGIPGTYDDVSTSLTLSGSVYPLHATSKEIIYTLEPPSGTNSNALVTFNSNTNTLSIPNYEDVEWWIENPNPTPPHYADLWLPAITNPIVIGVRVPNGLDDGVDYKSTVSIVINPPSSPAIHIAVDNLSIVLPSIVRARRPILPERIIKEPWTASATEIHMDFVRDDTGQPGFALAFEPTQESPEYWKEMYNIDLTDQYKWDLDESYLYVFEDILVRVQYVAEQGNADYTDYTKEETIQVLPEYIPVSNIGNIPEQAAYKSKIILNPEFYTDFPITERNTETYDTEIPSYTDVVWTVVNSGNTGAKIIDGVLSFSRTGRVVIQAEIANGTEEEFDWYGYEHVGKSYKQQFTIDVISSETVYDVPIATLKLNNGDVVEIKKVSDIYNISNDKPSDAYIEAGGVTFRKDQVISIEFWESHLVSDDTIPVEDISLSNNFISTYTPTTPVVETTEFATVTPGTDPDGCTLIEDESSPFNGMTILPEGVFLYPDGTIIRYIESDDPDAEDLILNLKYADTIFGIDPINIDFPDGFVRYDNGCVGIPSGTILNTNGNLIIQNPDYDGSEGTVSNLYTITTHGVVFDNTSSTVILPTGTVIRNGNLIILPDGYRYNPETASEEYIEGDASGISILLPAGTYVNSLNEICMSDTIKAPLDSITPITSETGNFLKFSDGSILFEDGIVYTTDGKLFDAYGREIDEECYFNITQNATITPEDATNKTVHWGVAESPEGSRLIVIPTDEDNTAIILAGSTSGYFVLDANIGNAFDKKILIGIGNTADVESRIIAINLSATSKDIYKGSGSTTFDIHATLLATDSDIESDSIPDIEWKVEGGVEGGWFVRGTSITPSNDNLTGTLYVSPRESIGNTLTVTVSCGDVSTTCLVNIYSKYDSSDPNLESLTNFARNFSNLKSINHIPPTVNGNDCLRNFLAGCTSFNQAITIPDGIYGERCLKGFLSGCTTFNKPITIPTTVTGTQCLDRFLSGCTSFNQKITIPENVTGNKCLHRFLENCTSFNQELIIPMNVSGDQCIDHCLSGCITFNKPITIPDGISGSASMRGFMKNTMKMTSKITISEIAAINCEVNGLTLACFKRDVAYDTGVPVVGTGASIFKAKCINMTSTIPLRKFI